MTSRKRSSIAGKIVLILLGLILLYAFVNSLIAEILIKRNGKCINGFIYRETYGGKTSPPLGYKFYIRSKEYNGLMTEDKIHQVGDSICIIYYVNYPGFNRPISYFTSNELKCTCQ